ncbi:hypothetical protein BDW69DRAFT_157285 [Aspergillus filifer]
MCEERDSSFLFFSAPGREHHDPLVAGFNLFLHSRLTVLFDSFSFLLFSWLALSFSRPLVRLQCFYSLVSAGLCKLGNLTDHHRPVKIAKSNPHKARLEHSQTMIPGYYTSTHEVVQDRRVRNAVPDLGHMAISNGRLNRGFQSSGQGFGWLACFCKCREARRSQAGRAVRRRHLSPRLPAAANQRLVSEGDTVGI